ncbi:YdcF family protein [Dyadobacter flavalbus]|nr:YdcF family protein [Dyadobacter flavalbus]
MRIVFLILSAMIILFSGGCGGMLNNASERAFKKGLKSQPYDAVIIPGFPYSGDKWDMILQMRIHWAHYLYTKGYTKNIIFSGAAVATPYIESKVMAEYAHALGVPRERIFTEQKAQHSTENVYYSYRMAKGLGFSKIALATDPVQTTYMQKFIKRYELPVEMLPVIVDTLRVLNLYEPKTNTENCKQENFVKLSDKENFIKRFRGTMGKNIVWYEEDLKQSKFRRKYKDRMIPSGAAGH